MRPLAIAVALLAGCSWQQSLRKTAHVASLAALEAQSAIEPAMVSRCRSITAPCVERCRAQSRCTPPPCDDEVLSCCPELSQCKAGRQKVAAALTAVHSASANALAIASLGDPETQAKAIADIVQAARELLAALRELGIPLPDAVSTALTRLGA